MAIRYAVANGNWSNTATWNGGTLPTSADDVFSNNFTVTIDGTFTVLTIRNTANTTPAITAGGQFKFANSGNLTCTAGNAIEGSTTTPVLLFDLSTGNSATFNGNCTTAPAVSQYTAFLINGTGTLNLAGDLTINNQNNTNRKILEIINNTTINLVGDINCGQSTNTSGYTVRITANCTINHTGNVTGGATSVLTGNGASINSTSSFTYNHTGNQTAGSAPSIFTTANSNLNIIGSVSGNGNFPAIVNTTNPATIDVLGITTSGSGYPAIQGLITTFVKVRGNVVHTDTYCAIYAGRVTIDDNVTSWQFKDSTNTTTRTLYTAGVNLGNPAEDDVRDGVDYGPALELTGTLAVPTADNVRKGVPIDDTIGTADLTAADMWNYLTSSITTSGSIGKLVKDNLDAQVSTIKTKTDNLPNDPASNTEINQVASEVINELNTSNVNVAVRLRNVATVETTGNQIADLS
jgi:hypothetical protein